jgi:hypothetical protein
MCKSDAVVEVGCTVKLGACGHVGTHSKADAVSPEAAVPPSMVSDLRPLPLWARASKTHPHCMAEPEAQALVPQLDGGSCARRATATDDHPGVKCAGDDTCKQSLGCMATGPLDEQVQKARHGRGHRPAAEQSGSCSFLYVGPHVQDTTTATQASPPYVSAPSRCIQLFFNMSFVSV